MLTYLASDGCINFEVVRCTVQGAFYEVFTRLREQGVLGEDARRALEAVDDYLRSIIVAIAEQVFDNAPALRAALAAVFDAPYAFATFDAPSKPPNAARRDDART